MHLAARPVHEETRLRRCTSLRGMNRHSAYLVHHLSQGRTSGGSRNFGLSIAAHGHDRLGMAFDAGAQVVSRATRRFTAATAEWARRVNRVGAI
jgi:hypothetical protein